MKSSPSETDLIQRLQPQGASDFPLSRSAKLVANSKYCTFNFRQVQKVQMVELDLQDREGLLAFQVHLAREVLMEHRGGQAMVDRRVNQVSTGTDLLIHI